MDKQLIKKNIICSLITQIVTVVCGFIVPRTIISAFGSETNGLVSSISQFLSYITLLEGGVSGVISAALYKPLAQNDTQKINAVVNASKKFFFQLGTIYTVYSVIIGIIYPLIKKVEFSSAYIFALTMVLASSMMMQYFFSVSYSILIKADRKIYLFYNTHTITVLLNAVLVLLAVKLFSDILIVKLISAAVYAINPIFFSVYANKHYKLDKKVEPDEQAISQRWDGFGQTLAYFIHSNTDIVILTFFSTLSTISVYSVYLLVASAMKNLVAAISNAIVPSIGHLIGMEDIEKVRKAYFQYEYGIFLISSVLFCCCMGLVVPFISVYTKGITDADYIQPLFGYLIVLAEMIYCFRDPSTSLIYAAGKFKQTAKYAYAEAGLNIVVSLCLVGRYGLVGVALGTFAAMALRWFLHIYYLKTDIIFASARETLKTAAIFFLDVIILIIIYQLVVPNIMDSYFMWVKYGILGFLLTVSVIASSNYLLNKDRYVEFVLLCKSKVM
ncbi:MAG: polysaccharide biosynthesis C-terminal domain-containing protein [Eubacteriales bacterium]|nr:polysaccharide biosynthesis C-terminal domain-containing protein [Eubacteriales bacterium]